ncbi:MAG: AAA family ATPase [Clostridia bacterium]|nr:AAA family ATPase [Clostridia bacterium]
MKYGLIGEHLPHSFSKEIHGKFAPYEYGLLELAPDGVGAFMEAAEFEAINVTIPYKQTVMPYLAEIHPQARAIGAVNTVVRRGGRLYGYNTDFYGMLALVRRIGVELCGKKVMILGTGGTAKTARAVAEYCSASSVITVGRRAGDGVICYEDAYARHSDAQFIINTTPCGMYPNADGGEGIAEIPIDVSRFPSLEGTVDAVYNPIRTNFVLDTRERGLPSEGGLYMLVAQAVVASRVFLGEEIEAAADDPETLRITDRVYGEILKEKENIVLTGMPGSGKSTVGRRLAKRLGRPFIDTDELIVKSAGKPITEIFAELGEVGFRDLETRAVREAANGHTGAVIATGGGAILRDCNVRALKRSGRVYFLNRSVEALLPTGNRPLASTAEAIRRRFEERYDRYLATADREVVIDEVIEHTISNIKEDFFG